jgi:hypothetical protein
MLLDQAIAQGTFSAISTFHFGNGHFLVSQPFLNRYRDVMPFIGLQDAHTQTWWWMEFLAGFRTLFLAAEPTWAGWLEALKHNWVVSVRHDARTGFETQVDGASSTVRKYVMDRAESWRWWGEKPDDIRRPWAALTAITPEDQFDELRPDSGVNLRVRCWLDTQPFGTPKIPVTELVSLEVDGETVSATHIAKPPAKGDRGDDYYLWRVPADRHGQHVAVADVRMIQSGAITTIKTGFEIGPRSRTPGYKETNVK